MSGMTGILGGWTKHLAAISLIVVLCAACGRLDSNIPSDEEMIEVFKTKEQTFSEIVELFQEFPSWEGYHPREQVYHNGFWPEDAESRSFFGEERALKIDSLLQEIGCENVHFRYSYSYYPTENICPVEYSFTYNARGLSIGPSIGRSFIYSTNPNDSAAITSEIGYRDLYKPATYFMAEGDLDSLYMTYVIRQWKTRKGYFIYYYDAALQIIGLSTSNILINTMSGMTDIYETINQKAEEHFEWVQYHPKYGLLIAAALLAFWLVGLLLGWKWACNWTFNGKLWFFDDYKPETRHLFLILIVLFALICCLVLFFTWK